MTAAVSEDVVHYFVHGVDRENVGDQLEGLAETHWAYMDAHADRLVARGPTLSADGTTHTGSVHVVEAASMVEARRFAFEEPYWLGGVYASVTVARFHSARDGTMWDRPPSDADVGSALVLVSWPAPLPPAAGGDRQVLRLLGDIDPLVFGGLLTTDDGSRSVGLVAAVDTDIGRAGGLIAGIGLPGSTTSVATLRWRRGGRAQSAPASADLPSAVHHGRMKWKTVHVDRERRFALEIEEESGRTFLSIPVSNTLADYTEWYEVDSATFERYRANPTLAFEFAEQCKRREMDHLLLLPPGTDRGWAT